MSGTRRKPGCMGQFVSDFQTGLLEQGYSALAVRNMLKDVGSVGRWMQEHDLQPSELSPAVITEFRSDRAASGRRKIPSVKSFEPLLRFLQTQGVIGEPPEPESPVEQLLVDYHRWLVAGPSGVDGHSLRESRPPLPSTAGGRRSVRCRGVDGG